MKNENEELSIKNWIHGNNHMKFKLLFRMSRDGTTSINFHTKCDSSGKTLILIETKEGKRIGDIHHFNGIWMEKKNMEKMFGYLI